MPLRTEAPVKGVSTETKAIVVKRLLADEPVKHIATDLGLSCEKVVNIGQEVGIDTRRRRNGEP